MSGNDSDDEAADKEVQKITLDLIDSLVEDINVFITTKTSSSISMVLDFDDDDNIDQQKLDKLLHSSAQKRLQTNPNLGEIIYYIDHITKICLSIQNYNELPPDFLHRLSILNKTINDARQKIEKTIFVDYDSRELGIVSFNTASVLRKYANVYQDILSHLPANEGSPGPGSKRKRER